jgi:hypothetical protein
MEQIGWWVVGDETALHGARKLGQEFLTVTQGENRDYWRHRGYQLVPAYANNDDVETWGVR